MTTTFAEDLIALLPRLRRFAMSLTGKAEEADDLVQAACERALRSQASFEPQTRLDAWLFRIIKNLWIDQIRRRKTEGQTEPVEEKTDLAGEDLRRSSEARLTFARVQDEIARLPPEQQDVLRLVCIEEMSYREAAEALSIPIGTVMSRLSRARMALASALEAEPSPARSLKSGFRP